MKDLWDTTNIASKLELLVKPGEGTARPGNKQEEEEKDVAILRAGREEEGRSGND